MRALNIAERLSLQAAQMIAMANRADVPEARDKMLNLAMRMADQARRLQVGIAVVLGRSSE